MGKKSLYTITIKESYLDAFMHVNNAMYLTLFEEARWDLITNNGYGLEQIMETGLGPVILEVKMSFLKELRLRDEIVIETEFVSHARRISKVVQHMLRDGEVCCTGEFTFGLFSLIERKLVSPTPAWLKAIGAEG